MGSIYHMNYARHFIEMYLKSHTLVQTSSSVSLFFQMDTDARDIKDKLDSLHRRMDKFYEWAAILQKEFKDMKQRQGFIESQCVLDFKTSETQSLYERLERIKEGNK